MITQRYGDLEIGFVTGFDAKLDERYRLGGVYYVVRPKVPAGWKVTGDPLVELKDGKLLPRGTLVLRDHSPNGDLLKPPVRYDPVDFKHDGGTIRRHIRPVAPPGYVALGDSFWAPDNLVCVKQEHAGRVYARQGETSRERIGHHYDKGAWAIVAPPYPNGDKDEHLLIPPGNFLIGPSDRPAPDSVTWVLDVPAVGEKGPNPELPRLESFEEPPAFTVEVTDRVTTVPYFMVKDPDRTATWKAQNSPFYKIQRKRLYELVVYYRNRTSEAQSASDTVVTGVQHSEEESFSKTTGIGVSVTAGVEATAGFLGSGATAKFETTISTSLELGYERRYGVTTFEEVHKERGLITPPGCAGAVDGAPRADSDPRRRRPDVRRRQAGLPRQHVPPRPVPPGRGGRRQREVLRQASRGPRPGSGRTTAAHH